jgi:hypothetical protein
MVGYGLRYGERRGPRENVPCMRRRITRTHIDLVAIHLSSLHVTVAGATVMKR